MLQGRRFESPLDPHAGLPGRYIHVRRCGGMFIIFLQLKVPLELFVKGRQFLCGPWFPFRRDMTCAIESDVETQSLLPSSCCKYTTLTILTF